MKKLRFMLRMAVLSGAMCLLCAVQAQAQLQVDANVETVKYEGAGYTGDLIRVTVSIPGREEIARQINTSLEETIFARELEVLDFVKGWAEEDPPDYNDYGAEASVAGLGVTDRILSVLLYMSNYAGGPHPWGDYFSANYDLESGQLLTVKDLFIHDDPWPPLKQMIYLAMSSYPSAENLFLTDNLFDAASKETDRLAEDNPSSGWAFDESGLCFYYGAGTIGVYAGGPIELMISAEQLRTAGIKEEYLETGNVTLHKTETQAAEPAQGAAQQPNAWQQGEQGTSAPPQGTEQNNTSSGEPYDPSRHSYSVVISDVTWQQADTEARNQGGHLATISCQEEQAAVEAVLNGYPGLRAVWIGGQRLPEGRFIWNTGEAFSYTFWGPGEPNNENGNENYMDMYPKDGRWVWNDVPGDIARYYSGSMGYVMEKDPG